MTELNPQPLLPKVVRIHVTREIAYDLDKTEKIRANVMDKLGCRGCTSGHILDFHVIDEFIVDPDTLDVSPNVVGPTF
ncbi:hypothetical protein ACWFRB_19110 [Rhodococcus sp. NPDC055112]